MSTADFNSNIIQMLILRRDEPARASPPHFPVTASSAQSVISVFNAKKTWESDIAFL